MDHADSQCEGILRGRDGHLFAANVDLALIREIDTGQHVHQCRLSAAVLAEDREDLTFFDSQTDLVVGHDAAEPFRDVF